jgi:ribonuclease BN (tRNA processing enzyme)
MAFYGGNTSCVEVVKKNRDGMAVPVIIDAGTGLIKFGYTLGNDILSRRYSPSFPLLFTHLHPDHTEGFNFFAPNFLSSCVIHILGMEVLRKNVGGVLRGNMLPPTFPIEYKDLKSIRRHGILNDGQVFYIGHDGNPFFKLSRKDAPLFEIEVMQAFAPSHPQQGALYYRIRDTEEQTSIACIWDIESHIGGDVRVIKFAHGADVMIHDSHYTEEEYLNTASPVQGFGHSTFGMAMENAEGAKVRYLIPFHYNPRYNDELLRSINDQYRAYKSPKMLMSREGLSLTFKNGELIQEETFPSGFAGAGT